MFLRREEINAGGEERWSTHGESERRRGTIPRGGFARKAKKDREKPWIPQTFDLTRRRHLEEDR